MTKYITRTYGPWDVDGGTGDQIITDGAISNQQPVYGNPSVDGVSPESRKRKHHHFPVMLDAPPERLVKARP